MTTASPLHGSQKDWYRMALARNQFLQNQFVTGFVLGSQTPSSYHPGLYAIAGTKTKNSDFTAVAGSECLCDTSWDVYSREHPPVELDERRGRLLRRQLFDLVEFGLRLLFASQRTPQPAQPVVCIRLGRVN